MWCNVEKPSTYRSSSVCGIKQEIARFKKGDFAHLESAIQFLERDEYFFRSGYAKEDLWRLLRRATLSEEDKSRLRSVALIYVRKRLTRDFFSMCRFVSFIGCEVPLREELARLGSDDDAMTRRRAALLLAYCQSVSCGEYARRRSYYGDFAATQAAWRKLRKNSRRKFR